MQKRGDREYRSNHRPRRPERERVTAQRSRGGTGKRAREPQQRRAGGAGRGRPSMGSSATGLRAGSGAVGRPWGGSRRSAAPPRGTHQPHAPGQHQQPGHRHAGTETLRGDEMEKTFSHPGPHRHRHRARPPGPLPARGWGARPPTRRGGSDPPLLRCAAPPWRPPRPAAPPRPAVLSAPPRRAERPAAPPAGRGRSASSNVPFTYCAWTFESYRTRVGIAHKSRSQRKLHIHGQISVLRHRTAASPLRNRRRSASSSSAQRRVRQRQQPKAERTAQTAAAAKEEQNDLCHTSHPCYPALELGFDVEFSYISVKQFPVYLYY